MVGDGITPDTAFRPIWMDLVTPITMPTRQVSDTDRHSFWIGVLDLTAEQHTLLEGTAGVFRVPRSILGMTLAQLPAAVRTVLTNNLTAIGVSTGVFGATATFADVLALLAGRAMWQITESDE